MKKLLSWALVLCLCLAMLSTAALADGLYTPGTYTGESSGHEAGLTVTVTVDENAITDVSIDVSKETATIGGAAGPALEAQPWPRPRAIPPAPRRPPFRTAPSRAPHPASASPAR